jgi:PAS domain-containing protein
VVKETKKPTQVEHIHYDQDGRVKNVEIHAYPIFDSDGHVVEIIEYCLDITERKRAEMQLKNLFEASKLINSTMDTDEIFRFISDSVQELVGFDNFIIFLVSDDKSISPAYASENMRDLIEGRKYERSHRRTGFQLW